MRALLGLITAGAALLVASTAWAAPATRESCGWVFIVDGKEMARPDPRIRLLGNDPELPDPPEGAKGVYCTRDSMTPTDGDILPVAEGLRMIILEEPKPTAEDG